MNSATDDQEGFKFQEFFIHFDMKETSNRPAFSAGQIFQPFDAYGRSLYSKLVKRVGEKKSNSSGQTVWYDPDGYIQPAKYQSHGIGNGSTNKGIVAGEVLFYGHK